MTNILLVNPNYRLEIRWVADEEDIGVKADYMPLGLATVAALTLEGFHVDILDELVDGPVEERHFERDYDIVGVTSHSANLGRALKIGDFFRLKGCLTIVGGPGATSNPDKCRNRFDIVFIGEAELTWPRFLGEWRSGNFKTEYRQIEKPDISLSPPPKWSGLLSDIKSYSMGTVQTTRGCPNDCEFCDVVYLNGRRQRHKQVEQILEEVRSLERLGIRSVSFNDDNLTVNHRWAKELLRELIPLNNSFPEPLRFMTQLSIDVARDDELMGMLADANFYQVLIGIESPNKESLKEAGKYKNLRGDLVEEIHKVLSYGIVVRGAMIVGFDNDGPDIFDLQYDFIQNACLPSISMHMLNAPVGTRLWRRLRAEGRVIDAFRIAEKSTQRLFNNIIPKRMSRVELMKGFGDLYERLFTWDSFRERMLGFVSLVKRPPGIRQKDESLESLLGLGNRLRLDAEACGAMEEIFTATGKRAPFMLARVKELVVQFVRYRESVYDFLPGLERQIELESSGDLAIELDSRPITVPKAFRDVYASVFTEVYRRIYLSLTDKGKVPEALVEVFLEFLTREEGFKGLQGHHLLQLNEISDRTCARLNGADPIEPASAEASNVTVPDAMKGHLHDDVLKGVEQELFKVAETKGVKL